MAYRYGSRQGGRPGGGRGRYTPRRKVCSFCVDKAQKIDYKESAKLSRYISDRGKIEPRRRTGTCARHQRTLAMAIKRARHIALLPYVTDHIRSAGNVASLTPAAKGPEAAPVEAAASTAVVETVAAKGPEAAPVEAAAPTAVVETAEAAPVEAAASPESSDKEEPTEAS